MSWFFEKINEMDKLLQSLTRKIEGENEYTAFLLSYKTYCNSSPLKIKFLDSPHTFLSTVNSIPLYWTPPKKAIYIYTFPTSLSSRFHLSPLISGFHTHTLKTTLWGSMISTLPNGKFSVFLHSLSATFNRLIIPSWNLFLTWLPGYHKPLISRLTGSHLSIFLCGSSSSSKPLNAREPRAY